MDKIIGHGGGELKLHVLAPPGELLREELYKREITQTAFAKRLGMRQSHFNELLQGKRKITIKMALKLEMEFGVGAEFWIGLQTQYALEVERRRGSVHA